MSTITNFTPEQIQVRLDRAVGLPENVAGPRPEWAVAAIVAEQRVDQSEPQTDYFGSSSVGGLIVLAWSRHKRCLFPEMRKAAAKHPETAHLATDVFEARVVFLTDLPRWNGSAIWAGQDAPLERDLNRSFPSQAEADAYIAGQPLSTVYYGETEVSYGWKISRTSIEHRENYSMGHGSYLSQGHYNQSGWKVFKRIYRLEELA